MRIYRISSRGQPTRGGSPTWWVGRGAADNVSPYKINHVTKYSNYTRYQVAGLCECGDEPSGFKKIRGISFNS